MAVPKSARKAKWGPKAGRKGASGKGGKKTVKSRPSVDAEGQIKRWEALEARKASKAVAKDANPNKTTKKALKKAEKQVEAASKGKLKGKRLAEAVADAKSVVRGSDVISENDLREALGADCAQVLPPPVTEDSPAQTHSKSMNANKISNNEAPKVTRESASTPTASGEGVKKPKKKQGNKGLNVKQQARALRQS